MFYIDRLFQTKYVCGVKYLNICIDSKGCEDLIDTHKMLHAYFIHFDSPGLLYAWQLRCIVFNAFFFVNEINDSIWKVFYQHCTWKKTALKFLKLWKMAAPL